MIRLKSTDDLVTAVSTAQRAALVCNGLSKGNLSGSRSYD